ncbi:MAG: ATP-dependent RNA helicase HrpA [Magnetococcales bacterium]|nr:ATP-dependent RNA helicase HrpA [Magnetococcales bacterium]
MTEKTVPDNPDQLSKKLDTCMIRDRLRLSRRLKTVRQRLKKGQPTSRMLGEIKQEIDTSQAERQKRADHLPTPHYPPQLPVAQRREEIAKLIKQHQVVVLCGETGSGKTTQLPKICLEAGRGIGGIIGMTQPRRIAARSISQHLAREMKTRVGGQVGYKVRFTDRMGPETFVKVMTDGILLAEIQGDRFLSQYDTLILDEAHERSLNIDFLLGYLKNLLPRRRDLKLIISSATLDTDKFSRHFHNAPIIEVSGRTYPVELRYRPLGDVPVDPEEMDESDLENGLLKAVDELFGLGPSGDVLVFLPGEREIREMTRILKKRYPTGTEIVPLFARLPLSEQNRVFESGHHRRVVLATNVAETSITVPGIRYVVDSGLARISRFGGRSQVKRLPVERIAQSSADQRKGRCGRLSEGVCIRLFSEADHLDRPKYTDPEILRTSLAAVILQLKAFKLGEIESFPFVDPPEKSAIRGGIRLLEELGALTPDGNLTEIGRQLARLPIEPRLGRMILAGHEQRALTEMLIIASALTLQDPRERPQEKRQAADESHNRWQDPKSDFLSLLKLWNYLKEEEKRAPSKNQFRKGLKEQYLSFPRIREWREIHNQLFQQVEELGLTPNTSEAGYADIHKSILAGLAGHVGLKSEKHEFTGTREMRFHIFPASNLFKKPPLWVVAGELVETSRLYARTVAAIEPEWIEMVAGHLCKKSHSDPHWEKKEGRVVAFERVTFQGLVIIPRRRIHFGPIDPKMARELFIRQALIRGEMRSNAPFFVHNQKLLQEIEELESKSRRRDLMVDEEALVPFFDERLPPEITDVRHFDRWRKQAERKTPRLLFFTREQLMRHAGSGITEDLYPGHLRVAGREYPLEYHFDPGKGGDGLSVRVPLALLNQLPPAPFEWLVPGFLPEKIVALLKLLPKSLRKPLVPLPHTVEKIMPHLKPGRDPLCQALGFAIKQVRGMEISPEAWREDELADHLRINFLVFDPKDGRTVVQGRDLQAIKLSQGGEAKASFQKLPKADFEREKITRWDFDRLPERASFPTEQGEVEGFPALRDEGSRVSLRLMDDPIQAQLSHKEGLIRLFMLQLSQQMRHLGNSVPKDRTLCQAHATLGPCSALKEDILRKGIERVFLPDGSPEIRDGETFQSRLQKGRAHIVTETEKTARLAGSILTPYHGLTKILAHPKSPAIRSAVPEIREHLTHLIAPGFMRHTPERWLKHLPRYLKGISLRLERLNHAPTKDTAKKALIRPLWKVCLERMARHQKNGTHDPELILYRWMLEEFRVSLFAQELGTSVPVSEKRLNQQWIKVKP